MIKINNLSKEAFREIDFDRDKIIDMHSRLEAIKETINAFNNQNINEYEALNSIRMVIYDKD